MYIDWNGREQEDSEMYAMREDEKMQEGEFKVACICGRMVHYTEMIKLAQVLTLQGYIVLMPFATKNNTPQGKMIDEKLDRMQFAKIDMSQEIYVVCHNMTDIGNSTFNEISYAEINGIPVHYHFV